MRHFSRLTVGGGWGSPSPQASTFSLTGYTAFRAAKRSGKLGGLQRLRGMEKSAGVKSGVEEGDADAALIPAYSSAWPQEWNTKTAWGGPVQYLEEARNPFGDQKYGLIYGQAGTPATYTSQFLLAANQGLRLRLFAFELPTVPSELTVPDVLHIRLGSGKQRWQLTRRGSSWELARLASAWSTQGQATLDALLEIEEPSEAEQEQIDSLRGPRHVEEGGSIASPDALFEVVESISLHAGRGVGGGAGQFYDITLLPEPGGRLNYRSGPREWESIEVPDALSWPGHHTITGAGILELQTLGPGFIFQVGRPVFARKNTLSFGPFFYPASALPFLTTRVRAEAATLNSVGQDGSTLLGTRASCSWRDVTKRTGEGEENEDAARSVYFDLELATTDTRFCAFLYAAQSDLQGGPRPEAGAPVFDTSEHHDATQNPPVLEATFGQDGEMKRRQWQITVRDPGGRVFAEAPGAPLSALQDRVATLTNGPTAAQQLPVLTHGIVQSATIDDLANLDFELARTLNMRGTTVVEMKVSCAWAVLDEDVMRDRPIGDGGHLGAHLRRVLLNGGFTPAEVANISPSAGKYFKLRVGEAPRIQPARGQKRGEYLRELIERWGMGWDLSQDRFGVWRFAPPATQTGQISIPSGSGGTRLVAAEFSSAGARNDSRSLPGRLAVLRKLSLERDFTDFYNVIEVEGAIDPRTGLPLCAAWRDWESLENEDSPRWIGREKVYSLTDDSIRDSDDLNWMLRSLRLRYGRSGRMTTFETYFHDWMETGQRITIDSAPHRVLRIPNASMRRDRMEVAALEL